MQKAELDYLKFEKRKGGKSDIQVDEEIDDLVYSQIEFKNIKKEVNNLKKIIERKDLEINKLKLLLQKKKEKSFKDKFKELITIDKKEDSRKNLRGYIKRILNNIDKEKEYTQSDLCYEFLIPTNTIKEVISILRDLNKLDFRIDKGVVRYKII